MSGAIAFLVRHRTVDLVGMSALHALRTDMGFGEEIIGLRRDDFFAIEGRDAEASRAWTDACLAQAHWYNPNKHRFACYAATAGAIATATKSSDWPREWLGELFESDRPDLLDGQHSGLRDWIRTPEVPVEATSMALAAWDREVGVRALPHGRWPNADVQLLRGHLWTLHVLVDDEARARSLAESVAVTTSRSQGLLIHPHVEGWAAVGSARA